MIAAVSEAFRDLADDPVAAIGQLLLRGATAATCTTHASSSSAGLNTGGVDMTSEWALLDWVQIAGVDAAVASALERHVGDSTNALEFLRGIGDGANIRKSLILDLGEAVVDALAQLGGAAKLQVCV